MVTVENKTKQTGLCTKQQLKLTVTSYAFLFVCLAFSGVLNMPRQSICGIAITGLHQAISSFTVLGVSSLHKAINSFTILGVTFCPKQSAVFQFSVFPVWTKQ